MDFNSPPDTGTAMYPAIMQISRVGAPLLFGSKGSLNGCAARDGIGDGL